MSQNVKFICWRIIRDDEFPWWQKIIAYNYEETHHEYNSLIKLNLPVLSLKFKNVEL